LRNAAVAAQFSIVTDCGLRQRAMASTGPAIVRRSLVFLQLLRQVVADTHLADGMQLRLEPVDVMLFVHQDLFRQLA